MPLLADFEIADLISAAEPAVIGLKLPADPYSHDSPIQPSSLDLHIGDIFIPGAANGKKGSVGRPVNEYILEAGQTTLVRTAERLQLPDTVAAFGFPPTRISARAILMTNPGHVDPGYAGNLDFTLINMGRDPFTIRRGDPVVTLLLVRLAKPPQKSYELRYANLGASSQPKDTLDLLSRDFLNVEGRATDIARREVHGAELRAKWLQIVVPIIVAIVVGVTAWLKPGWEEAVRKVDARVDLIAGERSVDELSKRLSVLEQKAKADSIARSKGQE